MTPRCFAAISVVVLALHRPASAQAPAASPLQAPPKWDVAVGLGTAGGRDRVADPAVPATEVGAEVGRYWLDHLRTAVGVANAGGTTYPTYSAFPEGFTETRLSARRGVTVSALVAYQFGQNLFLHPYVSAGVRVAWLTETRDRYATSLPYHTTTSSPTRDVRPVIGGGFKAYFANGRVFARPEFLTVLGSDRTTHSTVRVMVGGDF